MSRGKMAAQVAHASLGAILKFATHSEHTVEMLHNNTRTIMHQPNAKRSISIEFFQDTPLDCWLNGKFTKIVLAVESEEELLQIHKKAEEMLLKPALITDAGLTEFNGVPTNTCVGIGPYFPESFKGVTDHLKIFR
jgi:PTH2 family peptidyl-tRNA hydrolase